MKCPPLEIGRCSAQAGIPNEWPAWAGARSMNNTSNCGGQYDGHTPLSEASQSQALAQFRWLGWVMLMMFVLVQTAMGADAAGGTFRKGPGGGSSPFSRLVQTSIFGNRCNRSPCIQLSHQTSQRCVRVDSYSRALQMLVPRCCPVLSAGADRIPHKTQACQCLRLLEN